MRPSIDQQMHKFRQEYEKMHRALVYSRDSSVKLLKQFVILAEEYSGNVDTANTTEQATQEDQAMIQGLRDKIASIQSGLVQSAAKEEDAKKELRVLRGEISSLVTTVKQGIWLANLIQRCGLKLSAGKDVTRLANRQRDC